MFSTKLKSSSRCRKRAGGLLVVFIVGLLSLVRSLDDFARRCPHTVRVHQDGEPVSHQIGHADVQILSGGANTAPDISVFSPVLVAAACSGARRSFARSAPGFQGLKTLGLVNIAERKFADVVYRSGRCDPAREDTVATIRKVVETAGFSFGVTGYCGGTGYPRTEDWTGRDSWSNCAKGCTDSKIMLAFERFQPGFAYLSEKLFIPLEHGAVPAYYGNGQEWLKLLTVNPKCYVDRMNFNSDEAFAQHLVHLLKHPEELQAIQNEAVFLDPVVAERRIFYYNYPEKYGREGAPELFNLVRTIPGLKRLVDKPVVTYRVAGYAEDASTRGLQVALNASRIKRALPLTCPDIEYNVCCR